MATHFGSDVFVTWGTDERKANQEDIGLRVGEWAESVVIFLAGSIP